MNSTEILEGNVLIAKFMGLKQVRWPEEKDLFWVNNKFIENFTGFEDYSSSSTFDWGNSLPQTSNLTYNSNWNWLMPVVEKCFERYDLIENNSSNHQFKLNDALIEVNINSLWRAVVEFIKYYNKQKQQ